MGRNLDRVHSQSPLQEQQTLQSQSELGQFVAMQVGTAVDTGAVVLGAEKRLLYKEADQGVR